MLGAEELSGSLEEDIKLESFSWIKERLSDILTITDFIQPKLRLGCSLEVLRLMAQF